MYTTYGTLSYGIPRNNTLVTLEFSWCTHWPFLAIKNTVASIKKATYAGRMMGRLDVTKNYCVTWKVRVYANLQFILVVYVYCCK